MASKLQAMSVSLEGVEVKDEKGVKNEHSAAY
jgi:hypothetical protein